MAVLTPVRVARACLSRPHYRPCLPADIPHPKVNWHTDPSRGKVRQYLLSWAEADGIFRYGAWSKDPRYRPCHGTYWSSRASEFGRLLGLNLTEVLVGNCAGYAARIEDIVIPDRLRWYGETSGDECAWWLVPAECPSWCRYPPCHICDFYQHASHMPRCRLGETEVITSTL